MVLIDGYCALGIDCYCNCSSKANVNTYPMHTVTHAASSSSSTPQDAALNCGAASATCITRTRQQRQEVFANTLVTIAAALMLRFHHAFLCDTAQTNCVTMHVTADGSVPSGAPTPAENTVVKVPVAAPLLPINVHRLLLTALCVAVKLHCDGRPPPMGAMARAGGVKCSELCRQEESLLRSINWRVSVGRKDSDIIHNTAVWAAHKRQSSFRPMKMIS